MDVQNHCQYIIKVIIFYSILGKQIDGYFMALSIIYKLSLVLYCWYQYRRNVVYLGLMLRSDQKLQGYCWKVYKELNELKVVYSDKHSNNTLIIEKYMLNKCYVSALFLVLELVVNQIILYTCCNECQILVVETKLFLK